MGGGGKQKKSTSNDSTSKDVSNASMNYQKVSALEHVLLRPEMYIGSVENHFIPGMWMMCPDAKPRVLPKLLPAGPEFDASYRDLHGSFVTDENDNVKVEGADDNVKVEGSDDNVKVEGSDDNVKVEGADDNVKVEGADDNVKVEGSDDKVKVEGSDDNVKVEGSDDKVDSELISKRPDKKIKEMHINEDKLPSFDIVQGMIDGIDQRLCVEGDQNAEFIFGPGSLYQRDVWENPGLLKIVDEILVNAADNRLGSPNDGATRQTFIKVSFDQQTGRITVANDGNGIPIVKHKDHNLWIPEMIFGHLLTSSHYENDPDSVAAGRHGYGAKLTNIMSSEFTVTCHWKDKVFVGKWSENMKKCVIKVSSRAYSDHSFTEVSFIPEYDRFMEEDLKKRTNYEAEREKKRKNDLILQASKKKMIEMYGGEKSKEMIKSLRKKYSSDVRSSFGDGIIPEDFNIQNELFSIVQKRCLDLAASIGSEQKVYFNDVCLTPKVFSDYCRMHFPENEISRQPFYAAEKEFELGILFQPKTSKSSVCHVALVNGLVTCQGGSHLRHAQLMIDKVLHEVADVLKSKARVLFNVTLFKACSVIFVNATAHQPKFDSQSKAKLVSKHPFPQLDLSGLKDHILCLPFLNDFCSSANLADTSFLNMNLRKSKENLNTSGIPKLVEPTTIGNPNYNHVLILTEGDSAKALAVNSLSEEQRQLYGVYPLRGKVLNVRAHHLKKLVENVQVMNVFAIMGLTVGEKYDSLKKLRYKKILIMTDQDQDGMHIRGLLLNLFQVLWPQLLSDNPGFISIFSTPLVKARISGGITKEFYSSRQYEEWRQSEDPKVLNSAKIRYYKGLGTSTSDEGREYFKKIEYNTTEVLWNKNPSVDNTILHNMFSDTATDVRKRKMIEYLPTDDSFCEERLGTVDSFVEKDLMKYVIYDNSRSIVSGLDGLKTSNRKVLWALLKRDPPAMRVSQLAGHVSEVSNYHHGETSLHGAIIHMAQNYVTSNNINYLEPEGQFGSRVEAGKDFAAPRYIFTKLAPITRLLFPKQDDPHLTYLDSDGETVEPMCYAPVIPTAFLNGESGIGFGFSSNFTPHDPIDLLNRTRKMINGSSAEEAYRHLTPFYAGFRGVIRRSASGEFWCFPAVEIFNGVEGKDLRSRHPIEAGHVLPRIIALRITELPPLVTPGDFLLSCKSHEAYVKSANYSGSDHIDIDLLLKTDIWLHNAKEPTIECLLRSLGLVTKIRNANWTHSDIRGSIQSYTQQHEEGIIAIAKSHYDFRLSVYEMRLKALKTSGIEESDRLTSIIKFSKMVQSDVSIFKKTEEQLIEFLKENNVKEYNGGYSFLTSRPIVSFLNMNLDIVEKRLKTVKLENERLKSTTPKDLWAVDLNALEESYKMRAEAKKKHIDVLLASRTIRWKSLMDLYKSPMGANAREKLPSFNVTKKRFSINEAIKAEMMTMGWREDTHWKTSVRRIEERKKLVDRRQKLKEAEKNAKEVVRTVKKEGILEDKDIDDEEEVPKGKASSSSINSNSAACNVGDVKAPLTAPFSTMTAPLSIAIHPADTFVLMHAAMAHRAFAARQHMTALAVRRVGAIGVPVLGRLLSRFVF